jgi:hypothetical protein
VLASYASVLDATVTNGKPDGTYVARGHAKPIPAVMDAIKDAQDAQNDMA